MSTSIAIIIRDG